MRAEDLLALKLGEVTFDQFARQHASYVDRLAGWFWRRTSWCSSPVDQEDLVQIGWVELWHAVDEYRWWCPACPRSAGSPDAFEAHSKRVHLRRLAPRQGIFKYVHARVGRSMGHEMRRYLRRSKFHGEVPEWEGPAVPPSQEEAAELALLVEAARRELDPVRQQVLAGMALEVPRGAHGVSPKLVAVIRDELRDDFLGMRAC